MTGAPQAPCPRRAERGRPEAGARPGAAGDRAGPALPAAPPRRAKAAPHFQLGADTELLLVAHSVSHGPTPGEWELPRPCSSGSRSETETADSPWLTPRLSSPHGAHTHVLALLRL